MAACDALLERTRRGHGALVASTSPRSPSRSPTGSTTTGCGNGPFKMKLTIWRERRRRHFDWTGTDAQAEGPINFHIHEGLCKLFFGVYLIMAFDPSILFNEGFYDAFVVTLPEGTLLNPRFPAAAVQPAQHHTRFFDCQRARSASARPALAMAAGYGTSPYFVFSGYRRARASTSSWSSCCSAACRGGRSATARRRTPGGRCSRRRPSSTSSRYYPLRHRVLRAGAGLRRRGAAPRRARASRRRTEFLAAGEVTINDDRADHAPLGRRRRARTAAVGAKMLIRATARASPCRRR